MAKRARKTTAPKATVRLAVYLPRETIRAIGVACAMEGVSRRAWLTQVIGDRARRYVVQVRGGDSAPVFSDSVFSDSVIQ